MSLLLPSAALAQGAARGRPIRVIVPYSPGGATDVLARILAPRMTESLGQSVFVENRGGGNSIVGTEAALRATPDGNTLCMVDLAFVVNPAMYPRMPYDARRDAVPITLVASSAQTLIVHPDVPARNLGELVALAKARPGQLSFGSAGAGTAVRIAGEQFRLAAGIDILHVPYRGGGETVAALVSGEVSMIFSGQAQTRVLTDAGRARPLAISGARRGRSLPDVPTFAEFGYPDVDVATINGLIAPATTSPATIARLNEAVTQAMAQPEMAQRLDELGFDLIASTPDAFAEWIASQLTKWAAFVPTAGIRPE